MTGTSAGSHVQLFTLTPQSPVRWRLLSGNNREIGSSLLSYPDEDSARLAVKQAQADIENLERRVRRVHPNRWAWELLSDGTPVITSGHRFDRLIRCEQGANDFLGRFSEADIRGAVMVSGARRWARAGQTAR